MKYITIVILSFTAFNLLSQESPPPLVVKGSTQLWDFVLIDTNYVSEMSSFVPPKTKYSTCNSRRMFKMQDKLILHNSCRGNAIDYFGNMVNAIDLKSGKHLWTTTFNKDNYLDAQEYYEHIFPIGDDKIALTGLRKLGIPETVIPGWIAAKPSIPSKLELNASSGTILLHDFDQNDMIGESLNYFDGITLPIYDSPNFVRIENEYTLNPPSFIENDFLFEGQLLSNDFRKIGDTTRIDYTTDSKNEYGSYTGTFNLMYHLGDNSILGVVIQNNVEKTNTFRAKLIKMNYGVDNNKLVFDIDWEKNFENRIQRPFYNNNSFIQSFVYDDIIYISTFYIDTLDGNFKRSLLAIDHSGKEIFYLKALSLDNLFFTQGIRELGRVGNKGYFFIVNPESNKKWDIISIDDNGQIKFLSTFELNDAAQKFFLYRGIFTRPNEMVVAVAINDEFQYFAAFDTRDFGFEVASSTNDTPSYSNVLVYPNPSTDKIKILSDHAIKGTAIIRYQDGRHVLNKRLDDNTNEGIDISSWPSGIYTVQLISNDKKKSYAIKKFVKQ